jgi:primosomal protein N' (replication factor Y)
LIFQEPCYIDVILPLPINQKFTYQITSAHFSIIQVGCRVAVPFGRSKVYAGIVSNFHFIKPEYEVKYILEVLDETPIVSLMHITFWHWIADYYMCSLGEVFNAALPSSFKLANETFVVLHPEWNQNTSSLNDIEYLIVEAIELQKRLKIQEIGQILERKSVLPLIKMMQDRKIIEIESEVFERFKPKMTKMIRLSSELTAQSARSLLSSYKHSPMQASFLDFFLNETSSVVPIHKFCKDYGLKTSYAKGLVKKGIIQVEYEEVHRLKNEEAMTRPLVNLNPEQSKVLKNLRASKKGVNLLHGVTSSGKTEVYVHLMKDCLDLGKQVLLLVPEIALTIQLVNRLKLFFGEQVGVYHSRFGTNERAELWRDVKSNLRFPIIVGARSSVFLPFDNLGLIIVDEEHESSFKQQDPAPRYNARDLAVVMGNYYKAKVLLGSATPSLETSYNVIKKKFGIHSLNTRFGGFSFPEMSLVDISYEHKRKRMNGHFSEQLLNSIQDTFDRGEQVLLFQNRRGYAPQQECQSCGHVSHCKHCDVSLTYHKKSNRLRCHYCGFAIPCSSTCSSCKKQDLLMKGFGTEKIEDELHQIFPDRQIQRMDLDTTRKKGAYEELLNRFEDQEIDVLVGTQMISKGLDFSHVGLVGVLNADQMLNFPNFRAFERAFQMLCQVSGRAGRKKSGSKVLIQTFQADHNVLNWINNHNYKELLASQLNERQSFRYPPYFRLIHVTVRHRNRYTTDEASQFLASSLRSVFEHRILGPEYPSLERLKGFYQKQILIKLERELSYSVAKNRLSIFVNNFKSITLFKGVHIRLDVDPY